MSAQLLVALIALYAVVLVCGLANTLGYHRLLTHRSFKTSLWLRNLITFTAALYSGSPMPWIGTHRVHHAVSDTGDDPHSPTKGFWFAHCGWLCGSRSPWLCIPFALSGFGMQIRFVIHDVTRLFGVRKDWWATVTRDLQKERFMRFLDTPMVIPTLFAAQVAAAWFVGGWWGIAWLWGTHVASTNITWIVNSACHWPGLGDRPQNTRDDSRNVAWLALLTLGESNHNHHHKHQRSARHGLNGELDPTWTAIRVLERLGLAWDLVLPKDRREREPAAASAPLEEAT
jgi:stearoyl-CoA desaturase (delta-9 desaturase)